MGKKKILLLVAICALVLVLAGGAVYFIKSRGKAMPPSDGEAINVMIVYYNASDVPADDDWISTSYRIENRLLTIAEKYTYGDSSWQSRLTNMDMYTIQKGVEYAASLPEDSTDTADLRYRVFSDDKIVYDGSYIADDKAFVDMMNVLDRYN